MKKAKLKNPSNPNNYFKKFSNEKFDFSLVMNFKNFCLNDFILILKSVIKRNHY